jgi:integrase
MRRRLVLRSLINIIRRRDRAGKIYYQARFFDKEGKLYAAKSLPGAKFWSEAYGQAREMLGKGIVPSIGKKEAETFKTLTGGEVKAVYSLSKPAGNAFDGKPLSLRAFAAILLGLTGGLGVGEVINARFEDFDFDTNILKVPSGNNFRAVPVTECVAKHISQLRETYKTNRYIIPNSRDMNIPCDPITIHRSLDYILPICNIAYKPRNIVYSDLRAAFISFLLGITGKDGFADRALIWEAADYLCGYKRSIKYSKLYGAMVRFQIELEDLGHHPNDTRWANYKNEEA